MKVFICPLVQQETKSKFPLFFHTNTFSSSSPFEKEKISSSLLGQLESKSIYLRPHTKVHKIVGENIGTITDTLKEWILSYTKQNCNYICKQVWFVVLVVYKECQNSDSWLVKLGSNTRCNCQLCYRIMGILVNSLKPLTI